ncbi:MAG: metal-sulfur cluster assembly factor [Candidatus Nanohalobium sp.]
MPTKKQVREALKQVIDPELEVNIVDLGLIYEIEIEEDQVDILMTLTTPACPLSGVFDEMVRQEVGAIQNVNKVNVELTFEPRWKPEKMTDKAKDQVGHLPGMTGF